MRWAVFSNTAFWRWLGLAALLVALDQGVKIVVKLNMELHTEIPVLGNWFKLYFLENKGAAFGLTVNSIAGSLSEDGAKLLLTLISLALVALLMGYLWHHATARTGLPICIAFILGGALGNIIDRVFYGAWFAARNDYEGGLLYGRVVDMFYLDVYHGQWPDWVPLLGGNRLDLWPVFNIADVAITVGIVWALLFQKRLFPQPTSQPAAPTEPAETTPTATTPS
jgi:signal peptidase II